MPQVSGNLYLSRPRNSVPPRPTPCRASPLLLFPTNFRISLARVRFTGFLSRPRTRWLLFLLPFSSPACFFFSLLSSVSFLRFTVSLAPLFAPIAHVADRSCACVHAPSAWLAGHNLIARLVLSRRRVPRRRVASYRLRTSSASCSNDFKNCYTFSRLPRSYTKLYRRRCPRTAWVERLAVVYTNLSRVTLRIVPKNNLRVEINKAVSAKTEVLKRTNF